MRPRSNGFSSQRSAIRYWIDDTLARRPDCIVTVAQLAEEQRNQLRARGVPFVVFDPTIELPGDVAQTYVRDPAGNLMEIDTPGASRLPEALRREMVPLSEMFPQNEENRRARLFVREGARSL